jgi:hypothetical protein
MASQSIAAAQAVAQAVFVGEASTVKGLSYSNPNINIVQNGLVRTATVTYTAASANAFQGILGQPAWAISGSSTATSSYSPNINFYLLLDNSPSMNIAATTDGINTMVANTSRRAVAPLPATNRTPAMTTWVTPTAKTTTRWRKS